MASQAATSSAPVVVGPGRDTPANDADYNKLKQQFESVVTSSVGKAAVAITALAVPVVTAACAWLQKELGIKLDPAALTAFIASMAAGIVITAWKWLTNRGEWERSIVDAYRVYLTGQSATTQQVVVTAAGTPAAGTQPAPVQPTN
jgi:hypothetical protein